MTTETLVSDPTQRKLRIFALDPSLAAQYGMEGIAELTIRVPWEADLQPGPVGEYVEVVDMDPASGALYKPVDLNDPRVLAQDGLSPSETNPQFHQQMVYAVAMATIVHFEQALGRRALWATHRESNPDGSFKTERFVRRLRIYPHALRDQNAYYSPQKKALLFGYFPTGITDENNTKDTLVFTALSHDIIAHETTHALLDGVHPRFNLPFNRDVLAFHEAFADIVALFQRFSYPGVLRHQIAKTRGNLAEENLLAQLAQQFGQASGRRGALRDFLGKKNKQGKWEPAVPNVQEIATQTEPHARGAILVAAVFGAFLKVYRLRTADLFRIATEGTGVLRAGDIHPDLSNRLADEASKTAQYVLQMCIRALDYCPPVGTTFGDYLRALVTADYDFNPDDAYGYRLAIVESFRQWGIHPEGMRSMSVEALLWPDGSAAREEVGVSMGYQDMTSLFMEEQPGDYGSFKANRGGQTAGRLKPWNLEGDRAKIWRDADENAAAMWGWLTKQGKGLDMLPAFGIEYARDGVPPSVYRSGTEGRPSIEVHSVRWSTRRGVRGGTATDLVVEIMQRRRGYFDPEVQKFVDAGRSQQKEDFRYRAGCTLLIDPQRMEVRRVIKTAGTISDNVQLERVRRYLVDGDSAPDNAFWTSHHGLNVDEPFALLHKH